jgi:hypothetical protein
VRCTLRSIPFTVLFLTLVFSTPKLHAQLEGYNPSNSADRRALSVSLIQLIANPAAYNSKKVRVIGFLRLEEEGNALYLHREDFEMGLMNNAIWIDPPRDISKAQTELVNNQYVICEGVFRAGASGNGAFLGRINRVTRLEKWPHWPHH